MPFRGLQQLQRVFVRAIHGRARTGGVGIHVSPVHNASATPLHAAAGLGVSASVVGGRWSGSTAAGTAGGALAASIAAGAAALATALTITASFPQTQLTGQHGP